jgi:hypothetical protein
MLRHFLYAGRVDTFRRCSAASLAPPRALAFSPSCEKICGDQSYSALNIAFGTHFKISGCEAAPYSPPSTHANQEQGNHRVLVLALPRAAARGSAPRQVVHPRTIARNPGGAGLRPFTLFIMCIGTHFAGEREPLVTTAAQRAEISNSGRPEFREIQRPRYWTNLDVSNHCGCITVLIKPSCGAIWKGTTRFLLQNRRMEGDHGPITAGIFSSYP